MPYFGHVQNGVVVFDQEASLPEGTPVRIEPIPAAGPRTIAERFKDIIGTAVDLPEDMAENHDRYIRGILEE